MTNRKLAYIVKNQRPVVLSTDASVAEACRLMLEQRTGSVLVVDHKQRLVGIFTGRDAVRLVASTDAPGSVPLAKAMTRDPVTVPADARAIDALAAMRAGKFRHVPVVDGNEIWGVVARGDFKGLELEAAEWHRIGFVPDTKGPRTLADIVAGQRLLIHQASEPVQAACKSMSERGCGSALVVDRQGRLVGIFTGRDSVKALARLADAPTAPLNKAMTRDPVTIPADRMAIDALRTMCEHDFRHLPVVDGDRVLGVVSRGDFTGIELDRLDEERHLWECIR